MLQLLSCSMAPYLTMQVLLLCMCFLRLLHGSASLQNRTKCILVVADACDMSSCVECCPLFQQVLHTSRSRRAFSEATSCVLCPATSCYRAVNHRYSLKPITTDANSSNATKRTSVHSRKFFAFSASRAFCAASFYRIKHKVCMLV